MRKRQPLWAVIIRLIKRFGSEGPRFGIYCLSAVQTRRTHRVPDEFFKNPIYLWDNFSLCISFQESYDSKLPMRLANTLFTSFE